MAFVKVVPGGIIVRRRERCAECGKFLTWDEMGYGHDCEDD